MSRVFAIFLSLVCMSTFAQRTTEILNQDNLKNWSSTSDIDPRATVALADGRLVYFEDDSGFTSSKEDALILVDPAQGDQSGRFTVIASESTLISLGGGGTCCIYVADLALDSSGNLYAMVGDLSNSNKTAENYVVRIPYSNGSFGTPEKFSDFHDGGFDDNKTFHRLAANGGLIYASYDDLASGSSNGVYTQADTATNGATNDFTSIASHTDLAQVAFGTQNGQFRITAMVEDHLGGVMIMFHEIVNDDEVRGSVLRLDSAGNASVVLSSADASAATGAEDTFENFTCLTADRSTGDFYTFETGTAGNREQIWHWESDGTFNGQVGGYWQTQDAGTDESSTLTSGDANSFSLGGNYIYYWSAYNSNGKETLFRVDLLDTCPPTLSWPQNIAQNDDVSCHFGPRQLFSGNYRHDFHRGIDMALPVGTILKGTGDGVVDQAYFDNEDNEYKLRIRHNTNGCAPTIYSWYNHLSGLLVDVDDAVTTATDVALSGTTGTYDHLHFGVRQYNGGPDYAVNPLAYLPYTDTAPQSPTYLGGADDGATGLTYIEIAAEDEELDVAGLQITQGSTTVNWSYGAVNRANAPNPSTDLDTPIMRLDNGYILGVFPEWMRADIDTSRINIAIVGFQSGGASQSIGLVDVKGNQTNLNPGAFSSSLEPDAVFASQQAAPNQWNNVDFEITNTSGSALTIDFKAKSAMNFGVSIITGASLNFQAGETHTVTVAVDMGSDSNDNGDAVLLIAKDQGTNVLTLLRELKP